MKNKNTQSVFEPNTIPYLFFLVIFAIATFLTGLGQKLNLYLAAAEGVAILALLIYSLVTRNKRRKSLKAYIESVTYSAETAKNSTLMNFPLPIVVFRLSDSRIIWGNELFFEICGSKGARTERSVAELIPEFSGKWLVEGKNRCPTLLSLQERKYQICGNIVRSGDDENERNYMGITYWVDVTDYEAIRQEYHDSQPVAAIFAIDNFDELMKNQPERIRNDLRDAVGDKLAQWCEDKNGILRRFDRDRYMFIFESRYLDVMIESKFDILQAVHQVVSPSGIHATLSIGVGREAETMTEAMQFAELSIEMALSRGGDQAVIKNRYNFEFFGGKAGEVETRTKVKSRVMANALAELIKDASKVLVMGHRFGDMDSVGASVAVCAVARKFGVPAYIVADTDKTAAKSLIEKLRKMPEYEKAFITPQEAMLAADGKTLLAVVDTNRPEQVEDLALLQSCNKVAVIDHHRRAATYIERADFSYIEQFASSVCELMTEIMEVVMDNTDILPSEAEAMLCGIVLDTKNFTMRTGERTFDAAAFLRRAGADTVEVKKLMQSGIEQTVAKYRILQDARTYRSVAIAMPETEQDRIVAAQAADELLNVAGVEASMVMYPNGDGVSVSARAIGDVNVQMIMEKLGGGGNRNAAAAQIKGISLREGVSRLIKAIDEYMDN